ncbi:hypothetical protein Barb7_02411 [Bacteroidales bacterium Barb7]|nr:hypothetical protein Barb7_02411 [Bacteroidales bacterium Barb7]
MTFSHKGGYFLAGFGLGLSGCEGLGGFFQDDGAGKRVLFLTGAGFAGCQQGDCVGRGQADVFYFYGLGSLFPD